MTKTTAKAPAKKATAAKKTAKAATPAKPAAVKPINTAFNRTSLITHLAELAAVELKAVRAVMASLEATILASVHKKGLGSFTLAGTAEGQRGQRAGEEKAHRHRSVHQARARLRRQAGERQDQDPRAEEAEGRGCVI